MQTSPPLAVAAGQVAAGLLAAGAVLLSPAPGAVLLAVAGAALVAVGLRDLVLRPVLRADPQALTVVDGWRRREVLWGDVEQLRIVRDRRTPLLEIDLGDTVVVLSRRRLGAEPAGVLEELEQLRR